MYHELQSIDSGIKLLEAKGWFKEALKLKEKLVITHHECPVCIRLPSKVGVTILWPFSVCIGFESLVKCPVCKELIQMGSSMQ